jgi:hypothetical protein
MCLPIARVVAETPAYRKQSRNSNRSHSREVDSEDRDGNAGPWKPWKTKQRFPNVPTALGNRAAIPTFPPHGDDSLFPNFKTPKLACAFGARNYFNKKSDLNAVAEAAGKKTDSKRNLSSIL